MCHVTMVRALVALSGNIAQWEHIIRESLATFKRICCTTQIVFTNRALRLHGPTGPTDYFSQSSQRDSQILIPQRK